MSLLITLLLGAFILFGYCITRFTRHSEKVELMSVSVAFGTMLAMAVLDLIPEIWEHLDGWQLVIVPVILPLSILFLMRLDHFVPDHDYGHADGGHCSEANLIHMGILAVIAVSVHNIIEGMTVYSMSAQDTRVGLNMALGVGLHNIPMGMMIGTSLYRNRKIHVDGKSHGSRLRGGRIAMVCCATFSTFAGGLLMKYLWRWITPFLTGALVCFALSMLLYILYFELLPHIRHAHKPKQALIGAAVGVLIILVSGFISEGAETQPSGATQVNTENTEEASAEEGLAGEEVTEEFTEETVEEITLDPSWTYADFSEIHTGSALLFHAAGENRKNIVVGVNAGHGTANVGETRTYCHPDCTPKVTGGTTAEGSVTAIAVSSGMTFWDGTYERDVNLQVAQLLKEKLLDLGYDVLMIRNSEDVQLDNVARTVICNNRADCHIAIHFDSDSCDYDKGVFFMSVPTALKDMEPVAQVWEQDNALGSALTGALEQAGFALFEGGSMEMDLTQTSFSSVPSVDIELGNQCSDHSGERLDMLAEGLAAGVEIFFSGQETAR